MHISWLSKYASYSQSILKRILYVIVELVHKYITGPISEFWFFNQWYLFSEWYQGQQSLSVRPWSVCFILHERGLYAGVSVSEIVIVCTRVQPTFNHLKEAHIVWQLSEMSNCQCLSGVGAWLTLFASSVWWKWRHLSITHTKCLTVWKKELSHMNTWQVWVAKQQVQWGCTTTWVSNDFTCLHKLKDIIVTWLEYIYKWDSWSCNKNFPQPSVVHTTKSTLRPWNLALELLILLTDHLTVWQKLLHDWHKLSDSLKGSDQLKCYSDWLSDCLEGIGKLKHNSYWLSDWVWQKLLYDSY